MRLNRISAVRAIRDRLSAAPALQEFFQANFGQAGQFFIGVEKKGRDADQYPHITFVLPPQKIERGTNTWTLLIVVGVNEEKIAQSDAYIKAKRDAGESLGGELIETLAGLVLDNLETKNELYRDEDLMVYWDGTGYIISDMGTQHPFYEIELQLNMTTEPAP